MSNTTKYPNKKTIIFRQLSTINDLDIEQRSGFGIIPTLKVYI